MRDARDMERIFHDSEPETEAPLDHQHTFFAGKSVTDARKAAQQSHKHDVQQLHDAERISLQVEELSKKLESVMEWQNPRSFPRYPPQNAPGSNPRGNFSQNTQFRRNLRPCARCGLAHNERACGLVCTYCGLKNSHVSENCRQRRSDASLSQQRAPDVPQPPPQGRATGAQQQAAESNPQDARAVANRDWRPKSATSRIANAQSAPTSEPKVSFYAGNLNECGLPMVKVHFSDPASENTIAVSALLDCGSTLSLLSSSLYDTLYGMDAASSLVFGSTAIAHVGNGTIDSIGSTSVTFCLSGTDAAGDQVSRKIDYTFTVMDDLPCELLLGNIFITQAATQTDSGRGTVSFPHYDVSTVFERFSKTISDLPPRSTLYVDKNFEIPPFSVRIIDARHGSLDPLHDSNRTGVVVGLARDNLRGQIFVPQALVTVASGVAKIAVANVTEGHVKLFARRTIATIAPIWRAEDDASVVFLRFHETLTLRNSMQTRTRTTARPHHANTHPHKPRAPLTVPPISRGRRRRRHPLSSAPHRPSSRASPPVVAVRAATRVVADPSPVVPERAAAPTVGHLHAADAPVGAASAAAVRHSVSDANTYQDSTQQDQEHKVKPDTTNENLSKHAPDADTSHILEPPDRCTFPDMACTGDENKPSHSTGRKRSLPALIESDFDSDFDTNEYDTDGPRSPTSPHPPADAVHNNDSDDEPPPLRSPPHSDDDASDSGDIEPPNFLRCQSSDPDSDVHMGLGMNTDLEHEIFGLPSLPMLAHEPTSQQMVDVGDGVMRPISALRGKIRRKLRRKLERKNKADARRERIKLRRRGVFNTGQTAAASGLNRDALDVPMTRAPVPRSASLSPPTLDRDSNDTKRTHLPAAVGAASNDALAPASVSPAMAVTGSEPHASPLRRSL